jgi:hypothetical protein
MAAKYVLASLALVFFCAGEFRMKRAGRADPGKAWLLIGAIFSAVSLWLFING